MATLTSEEPCPSEETPAPAASLDRLPVELLMEVVSWLDWRSMLSLERVSDRCGAAVDLHLGRLRAFRVTRADLGRPAPSEAELVALLSRLTALRELYLDLSYDWMKPREVQRAVVAASRRWPRLERLTMYWSTRRLSPSVLRAICDNCPQLTDVTLSTYTDGDLAAMSLLTELPCLRAFRFTSDSLKGSCLTQLPTELRLLVIDCRYLDSTNVKELARCRELRSLELHCTRRLEPAHLAAGLAGCVKLERLTLTYRDEPVSECLPPAGLPALRHLDLTGCYLTDADLGRLLQRQPSLTSVCLARCYGLTQHGLALLGRLPALSSLNLVGVYGVSDWVLTSLGAAPLVELQLGVGWSEFSMCWSALTVEGLFRLHQACPTLRKLKLWLDDRLVGQVECGPGVDEGRLLHSLRNRMQEVDLIRQDYLRCLGF